ncbi:MAG: quinone-dependent dihydroorotate dehydrogenase [Legionella sp.]|nr:quinone-dependent dihydroorotate dehydrogenase [Legionella sp.]
MYSVLRPLLFKCDAENAHNLTLSALKYVPKSCFAPVKGSPVQTLGLTFPHVVGLAAGLDKNGEYLDALAKLGFSFIEVGTVTPKPQMGNPKPRLYRLPEEQAIINRMGFNNHGVDVLLKNVEKAQYKGILGINIGKNKDTSLNKAAEDYIICLRKVYSCASYITINISSPNTPDLRQLQHTEYFASLLGQIKKEYHLLADQYQKEVPLLIKVSPDEPDETLKQMTEVILAQGINGIIATNTTCSREGVKQSAHADEAGGLSGKPLFALSTHCLRLLRQYAGNEITLIGAGGIDNLARAQEKIDAGASLIQIYSGLIYQGPKLISELAAGLKRG